MSGSAARLLGDIEHFKAAGVASLALFVADAERACELFLQELASPPSAAGRVEVRLLDFDSCVQVIVCQGGRCAWRCFTLDQFVPIKVGRTIAIKAAIRDAENAARRLLEAGGGEPCLK